MKSVTDEIVSARPQSRTVTYPRPPLSSLQVQVHESAQGESEGNAEVRCVCARAAQLVNAAVHPGLQRGPAMDALGRICSTITTTTTIITTMINTATSP